MATTFLTYKYRLYPTEQQAIDLDFLLWQGRTIYNLALEQRITAYRDEQLSLSRFNQEKHFKTLRNANLDTFGKLNATCMHRLLARLEKAFAAFFRRVKAGETPGFPRFKSRSRFNSLEYKYGNGCKLRFTPDPRLYVQNVGEIKVLYHRPIPGEGKIKTATVKRTPTNKWFVTFCIELPAPTPAPHLGLQVGVDVGLRSVLALSNGDTISHPRYLSDTLTKLRRAQRRVSRRQLGSKRRRQAVLQVAKLHEKIANQRADFWHKTTRQLANTYSLIAIEDLTLNFMLQNPHLARIAHDASLGYFRQLLSYKVENTGSTLVAVNPAHTSQLCSTCGGLVHKLLSERTHNCPACGTQLDRDVNAAINILISARSGPASANVGH